MQMKLFISTGILKNNNHTPEHAKKVKKGKMEIYENTFYHDKWCFNT